MVAQQEQPVFVELRSQLVSNGAVLDGIAAMDTSSGDRGLIASRELSPNQIALRLTNDDLITAQRARASPVIEQILKASTENKLQERFPDVGTDIGIIALYVLLELVKGDESSLKAWFDTLPNHFSTPLTEDEDEVHEMLAGSPALYLVMRLREELREMYDEWFVPFAVDGHPASFPAEKCTFERFLYVHSVCGSRSFEIEGAPVLAPFADMANHRMFESPAVNLRMRGWRMADRPDKVGMELYVCSTEPVRPGTELCISYGPISNDQMLIHYGFVIPGNPVDGLPISLEFPEEDTVRVHTKKIILQNLDSTGLLSLHHELTDANPLPASLLASTRLLLLNEQEVEPVTMHTNFGVQVSRGNEEAVKTQLGNLFQNMLDGYPDPVDADELKQGSLEHYCWMYVDITTNIIRKALAALHALP